MVVQGKYRRRADVGNVRGDLAGAGEGVVLGTGHLDDPDVLAAGECGSRAAAGERVPLEPGGGQAPRGLDTGERFREADENRDALRRVGGHRATFIARP